MIKTFQDVANSTMEYILAAVNIVCTIDIALIGVMAISIIAIVLIAVMSKIVVKAFPESYLAKWFSRHINITITKN